MKMKTLAALVGSLSIGALATGCASSKAAERQDEPAAAESTTEAAPEGGEATDTGAEATPEKGTEGSCGAGSCGAGSCGGGAQ